ncbi:hypothetical protein L0Y65_04535 [Candidatus Micrarchaeota archaeon]|nr:hypothetical protein [Candidatus Micrarchaeota archaeon]
MRGANIFVIMLVVGMILFGCTGPANPPAGGQAGSGIQTEGQTQQEQTQQQDQQGPQAGEQEQQQTQEQQQEQEQATEGDGLAGQTYEALATMGVPLQCDMTVNSTTVKVYMKGGDEVRSEVAITQEGSTCGKMVSIMKGDDFYMGCADGTLFPQCDWLHMTSETTGASGPASSEPPDYSEVPPAKINCVPWIYDASKFATPGKVCSMDDLMQGYQQGDYPGGND